MKSLTGIVAAAGKALKSLFGKREAGKRIPWELPKGHDAMLVAAGRQGLLEFASFMTQQTANG